MKLSCALAQVSVIGMSYATCGNTGAAITASSMAVSYFFGADSFSAGEPPCPTTCFFMSGTIMTLFACLIVTVLSVLEVGYPNLVPDASTGTRISMWLFTSLTIDLFFNCARKADYNKQLKFSRGGRFEFA